jgi:hypothetical protein
MLSFTVAYRASSEEVSNIKRLLTFTTACLGGLEEVLDFNPLMMHHPRVQ